MREYKDWILLYITVLLAIFGAFCLGMTIVSPPAY